MSNEDKNGRRSFVKKGLSLGALGAIAASLSACQEEEQTDAVETQAETGEKVKLLSPEGKVVEVDKAHLKELPEVYISREKARHGIEGSKFVMVIDLAKCKNLRKCQEACEVAHALTEDKLWLKVLKMQENPEASPYWQPTPCFHCDNPPCVKVCPVDATYKRKDGIVLIDNERCIGCRFCMVACPYSARVFDWDAPEEIPKEVEDLPYSPEYSMPPKMGTVSKCDFCPDMARMGKLPHCVTACPNGVFYFGDENEDAVTNGEETLRLSELLTDRAGYRYLEELGTKPRVYYLPPYNRLFPFEETMKESEHEG